MLECVMNLSEGRDGRLVSELASRAGTALLDSHRDPYHNRCVLTLAGPDVETSARAVAETAVRLLDLSTHEGVHPRFGVVDVVPFVALPGSRPADAVKARDRYAAWSASELGVPCFVYGPERDLPTVRRRSFKDLAPDTGPSRPHPRAGATAVGARGALVAYNLWLADPDLARAGEIATSIRGPHVRALALAVGEHVQVSVNLVAPDLLGPGEVYDAVAAQAPVARAELVGLVPARVLATVDESRWPELGLDRSWTVEARLDAVQGSGGTLLERPAEARKRPRPPGPASRAPA